MAGPGSVKITPDSNVLIRAAVASDDPASDDARQAREAIAVLRRAELLAVTVPALCEFVWVLRRVYRLAPRDIVRAIRSLCSSAAVVCDRPSVEAGLAWLEAGGDFADGVIAAMGHEAGGDTFVSFDKSALRLGQRVGLSARGPSELLGGGGGGS